MKRKGDKWHQKCLCLLFGYPQAPCQTTPSWGDSEGLKPHMYEQKLTQGVYKSYLLSEDGAQGLVTLSMCSPSEPQPSHICGIKA